MITKQLSLFALMVSFFAFSQNNLHQSAQHELSNDLLNSQQNNYQRIRINNVNENTLHQLQEIGVDMSCGAVIENNKLTIELFDTQLEILQDQGINYSVLIDNMQEYYSARATADISFARAKLEQEKALSANKSYSVTEILNNVGQYNECDEIDWAVPTNWNLNPNSSPNSFGGCLTFDMVLQELDDMRSQYPNLISVKANASPTNQLTIEGRTVYYVRISDNPNVDEAGEPETLYQSLIHSREAASVMQLLYYMWYLLENYDTDDAIKNLVDNQALYFIPVFNPDGFVYNQTQAPNGGGNQRKNRNTSAPGNCSTYLDGIDLNRNSAYYWGNGGSSTNSCSDTYLGTAPFSENETQIMRDFFLQHDFELALNHHSFKNAMLHAYAGTTITNPRPDEYSKYNHDMTYYNRYAHGPSTSISSLNSGNMNDWMLGGPAGVSANGTPTGTGSGKDTMAWTPENGTSGEGGFWPAPSNFLPISKRAMRMNFMAAYFSGKYAKLHDLNQSDFTSLNGNLEFAIERLGQTDGDFTLTVTPVSSNILTIGGPSTQTGMTVLQQNNVAISYTLDPSIQANDVIEFKVVLTNDYTSGNVLYEANIVKQFSPNVSFSDNPDTDGLSNWTTSGGTWSVTSDSYSGSSAITSTASAPYSSNESKQIQMNGSIDLTGVNTALIQYYAKWDLERSFDYVQIEGSTNGTNWTPLCGKLTKPGAPDENNTYSGKSSANNNFQPDGVPLYDGDMQDKWNLEEVVIDASTNSFLFNQSTVFLRFDFKTDGTNREDSYINVDFEGFTFDDFKVISIQVPCITAVPTNLNASSITDASATLSWDVISGVEYDLRYKESANSTWEPIVPLTTNTFNLTPLLPLTEYEVQVRSRCSGGAVSNYSSSVLFTTLDVILNYCASTSTNVNDEFISNVELNTINNSSGAQFYSDFTGISTNLTKGTQYTITITPTWTGTIYNEAYSVWIDYNRDGDFEDSGEQVWTQSPTQNTPVSGDFTIPLTAVENSTRMRVSMKYNDIPDTCETFQWGEVEDYTIIIEPDAPDIIPPVITLIGSSTIDLDVGGIYTEQGATATDNIDGDITGSIIIGGDVVNTSVVGVYIVTYNVSDAAGNAATEVTRTVNVVPDIIPPVITLIGSSTIDLDVGGIYTEQGATATDNIDGDITGSIIIGGDVVNTSVAGTYIVTYNVSDAAGNAATEVTRTVNVVPDIIPPVITLIGSSTIDLDVGGIYTEQGATATDNIDGDITGSIVIGGDVVNTSVAGTYIVTYNVSDAAGNAATEVTRTVNVIPDTTAPVITLVGSSTIDLDVGGVYTEQGATATDNIDGDITGSIIIGGDFVNTSVAGTYIVTYNVSDAAGNAATEVTRTVNVVPDIIPPVITLIGSSTIDLDVGGIYTEQGATATDNIDGDITGSIIIGGDVVNTSVAGTYIVTYNVSDTAGNAATEVTRTVTINPISNGCSGGINSFPYSEGFEGTLGGWTQSTNDDLDWLIDANGTPSNGTGPSAAFEGNDYIYVEASGNGTGYPNKQAIITSPCFNLTGLPQAFFNFKYHMFGSSNMGTIDLEISNDDGQSWNSIWNESGNKGNSWQTASVDISLYIGDNIQLRFNRVTGGTWQADIAIDAIELSDSEPQVNQCNGQVASYPYTEGFENGNIGAWSQSTADDLNWLVDANGTPSNGTGPSSAFEGSNYIYVEASGNGTGYPTKQAIITSPCFDLTNQASATFEFNYHMYGSTNAGTIDLEVSADDGLTWTSIWTESGNNGNSWFNEIIDLNAYIGSSIQLRFNRVTGGTWQADVAIDGINLTATPVTFEVADISQNNTIKPRIRLYPNPVNNTLHVVSKDFKPSVYRIFNKFNQVIIEGPFKKEIDVSLLKSGVYYLKLIDNNKTYVEQFIKK